MQNGIWHVGVLLLNMQFTNTIMKVQLGVPIVMTTLGAKRIPTYDLSLFAVSLNSVSAFTSYILVLYFKTRLLVLLAFVIASLE